MQRRRNNNKRASVAVTLAASVLLGSVLIAPQQENAVHASATAPATTPATTTSPATSTTPGQSTTSSARSGGLMSAGLVSSFEPYYAQTLAEWQSKNYANASSTIRVNGADITAQSHQLAQTGSYQGKSGVLVWKNDRESWVEYKVNIDRAGLYQLNLQYHPYTDPQETQFSRRPVMLSVTIDDEFPFREARAIPFRRLFRDDLPVKKDEKGDDIRPRSLPVEQWIDEPFRDSANAYSDPLKWYFPAGEHTIRLAGSEPIVISQLTLTPPNAHEDYASYLAKQPNTQAAGGQVISLQAEEMTSKNDAAIQMAVDKDALSLPEAGKYETFNTVGGTRWQTGGQTINWSFTVPESGRYQISMRALQNTISNMSSFRTIAIDGKVPFKELNEYQFHYAPRWKGITLSDKDGKPFEIYLEKGQHTLSMTATTGPFQSVIIDSELATAQLRELTAELKALTGNVVDKNRTWKIQEDFPELPASLEEIHKQMGLMAEEMLSANGIRENVTQILLNAVKDIESYLRYPNEIPYYMDDISSLQEKIGAIRETLVKAPLQLDQIHIVPVGAEAPRMEANFIEKTKTGFLNFFRSFSKKEDITEMSDEVLNVWVNRGRDWVNLLQELSNEIFTPQTGIKVKVSLLPDENLLIYANAAGISPDIALGQPQDKSIDFAMRNALYDLTKFPDFNQVKEQFAPGALVPFFYNGGYYALPEQQSFKVLFYRKDILERLNLGIPDTWQDVYDMLPTLQQSGYNFYVPHGDFITFIYQNGGEFFRPDGMQTALNSPEAFAGFKQWTDMFNIYDIDRNVPSFYQHFRKGNMPIGVADYNTYVTLAAAAPELTGWWGIAPLPGHKNAQGVVERWSSGGQTTGFIYESSKKKDEAWEFLKWLVSADTQARYGNDLESFNGITFRWNTANIEAFTKLPWPKEDMKVILEQWKWYKEMHNPPGAYFVPRELNNAWTRTVVSGMNYRESLEEAIVNIDREMTRKEQEFGFVAPDGTILHTLDLPQVTKPWEGVDRFVPK